MVHIEHNIGQFSNYTEGQFSNDIEVCFEIEEQTNMDPLIQKHFIMHQLKWNRILTFYRHCCGFELHHLPKVHGLLVLASKCLVFSPRSVDGDDK